MRLLLLFSCCYIFVIEASDIFVVCPKQADMNTMVLNVLSGSSKTFCSTTEIQDHDKLLLEAENSLPVFVYDKNNRDLTSPQAILCTKSTRSALQKALKTHGFHLQNTTLYTVVPLYWKNSIPIGTGNIWLEPISSYSDDMARFLFEQGESYSKEHLLSFVQHNYPKLSVLLQQKSPSYPGHTVLEASIKHLSCLKEYPLSPTQRRALKVALLSHELGALFGSSQETFYNSLPLALALAEKVGCTTEELSCIELLFEKKEPSQQSVKALYQDALRASQKNIPATLYIPFQEAFFQITSSQKPSSTPQLLASLCFGLSSTHGPLPGRKVFSSYLWELRDPLHRDGLRLKKIRDKFELWAVQHPFCFWKKNFWKWVDQDMKKRPLSPSHYCTEEERELYRPSIRQGKLYTHDGRLLSSEKLIFVLDTFDRLYIAKKKDGTSLQDRSFNHASFTQGAPVASSGTLCTNQEGYPILLSNVSGHYRPTLFEMQLAVHALQEAGVDISTLTVSIRKNPVTRLPKMRGIALQCISSH